MHGPVTDDERAADERAAEERRLRDERWQWGGRLPSERLRAVRGSNVLGLVAFDSDLVHALDAAGADVQRSVALPAACRACETAGLTTVPWVARALTALAEGQPLPPPFDDTARMWETLRSTPLAPGPPVRGATPPGRPPCFPPAPAGWAWVPASEPGDDGAKHHELGRLPESRPPAVSDDKLSAVRADVGHVPAFAAPAALTRPAPAPQVRGLISQPHFALPAVLAAAEPSPLEAAPDAVSHALETYGEHYPELLKEIRSFCADRSGGEAAPSSRRP
ncbi:hypothetical protein [Streptomyces roseolus]|uniref:hypothetical protein n=1 Tax=Streptomyces roseolus TaxID=67358 RepID=UPI00199FA7C2|nr:hypothetical protein [Streptomyces roseolus]GGR41093.1 hypothetical protein GCM10010282_37280 [Streptomyces roseolus]